MARKRRSDGLPAAASEGTWGCDACLSRALLLFEAWCYIMLVHYINDLLRLSIATRASTTVAAYLFARSHNPSHEFCWLRGRQSLVCMYDVQEWPRKRVKCRSMNKRPKRIYIQKEYIQVQKE
jgi:hypothetical protein